MTRPLPLLRDALLAAALLGLLLLIAARLHSDEDADADVAGPFQVIDGDTLAAAGERLRLVGIDAPELHQTCRDGEGRDWDCGAAARETLLQLMERGGARCRGSTRDRYDRLLAECSRHGGKGEENINAEMVRQGMAVASGRYHMEEMEARAAGRGIWTGPFETPRQWRSEKGKAGSGGPGALWDWVKTMWDWNGS